MPDFESDSPDPSADPPPAPASRSAPSESKTEGWLDAFFSFLPSYWLAVALLTLILVVTAAATIFEAKHDAGFARYMVYDRGWFEFLLLLLGVNLAAAAMSRWPWKRRHIGFLVTHLGLIVILAGSAVGRYFGWEGQLRLMEGETGNEVLTNERLLRIATPWETSISSAEFEYEPPTPAHPFRLEVGEYAVTIDRYYPAADIKEAIERDPHRGGPAVRVRFASQFGVTETWLLLEAPHRSWHEVGPARIRFAQARTVQELRKLTAPPSAPGSDDKGTLTVRLKDGERVVIPVAESLGKRISLGEGAKTLTISEYIQNASSLDHVSDDGPDDNPALKFRLQSPGQTEAIGEEWLFYYLPFRRSLRRAIGHVGLVDIEMRLVGTDEERDAWLDPVGFLEAHPHGQLRFRCRGRQYAFSVAEALTRKVPVGDTGVELELLHFFPFAKVNRQSKKIENAGTKLVNPAVHFRAKRSEKEEERWAFANFPNFSPLGPADDEALIQDVRLLLPSRRGNRLAFICGPGNALSYSLRSATREPLSGPVTMGKPIKMNWGELELVVERYVARAVNRVILKETEEIGRRGRDPAVRYHIDSPGVSRESVAFAAEHSRSMDTFHLNASGATGIRSIDYRVKGLAGKGTRNLLTIVHAPDGLLHYVVRSAMGQHRTGPIELKKAIPLPWMHKARFRVEEYLEDGVINEHVVPATRGEGDDRHLPALHAIVRKGPEVGDGWVWWGAVHGTEITVGSEVVNLAYYNRTIPLGFEVQLLDFRDVPNPGGGGIASFESDVVVLDVPERLTKQATISMNHPLKYEGALLCQSSYIKAKRPGEGDISVLSASYDPGVPIVYAGFVLVMVGIAVTFYAKPRRIEA